jgi:hypothetical protein
VPAAEIDPKKKKEKRKEKKRASERDREHRAKRVGVAVAERNRATIAAGLAAPFALHLAASDCSFS